MKTYYFNISVPTVSNTWKDAIHLPTYSVLAETKKQAADSIYEIVKLLPLGTSWSIHLDQF